MVKLRLRRKGRIHNPVYDIVAVDVRVKRDGGYIERVGFYDPNNKPSVIRFEADRAIYWLNNGAQPTNRVQHLLSYEGVLLRRALQFKGKTEEEIEAEVEKHKQVAKARYDRRAALRKKRKEDKIKAEEEAKNAPAPAEEAPVDEAPAAEEAAATEE